MKVLMFKVIMFLTAFVCLHGFLLPWITVHNFMPMWADMLLMSFIMMMWIIWIDHMSENFIRKLRNLDEPTR